MRACGVCERTLAGDAYYKGVTSRCRECHKEAVRRRYHQKMQDPEWRKLERARNRERMAKRWRENPKVRKRAAERKRQAGPVPYGPKRKARTAVSNAIRDGRLIPADACEDCGHDFSGFRREGHHEDYSKPLEVVWLCALCHGKRHRSAA